MTPELAAGVQRKVSLFGSAYAPTAAETALSRLPIRAAGAVQGENLRERRNGSPVPCGRPGLSTGVSFGLCCQVVALPAFPGGARAAFQARFHRLGRFHGRTGSESDLGVVSSRIFRSQAENF